MGARHGHHLHYHGHSPVHRLPAEVKLVALLTFVFLVVATPREAYAAFGAHLAVLVGVVIVSGVPWRYLLPRFVVEVPFLIFAALMPFVATGPRVEVGPFLLSEAGLVGAWGLAAKATLGTFAALIVATTTEPRDLVVGLERLHVPGQLVQIAGFMIRYLEVVAEQLTRMRIARESRGFRARSPRQWPALGASAGALFIRSYERGERVHLAMLSRGYTGTMPRLHENGTAPRDWLLGALVPAAAAVTLLVAVLS